MTTRIRGVLFDMDGVLIDAREWHHDAFNRALGLFGLEITRTQHLTTYDGLPTKKKLELLSREHALPAGLHPFISELKQRYTVDLVHQHCRPTFLHQFALSRLRQRGLRVGVCSNAVRSSVDLMMNKAGLAPFLELSLSSDDVKSPKPDPEIYLAAMARLGLQPAETLVLEDNQHGLEAAQRAGAHVLPVAEPNVVTLEFISERIRQLEGASA